MLGAVFGILSAFASPSGAARGACTAVADFAQNAHVRPALESIDWQNAHRATDSRVSRKQSADRHDAWQSEHSSGSEYLSRILPGRTLSTEQHLPIIVTDRAAPYAHFSPDALTCELRSHVLLCCWRL